MIKTYRNGRWHDLAGGKIYTRSSWRDISGNDKFRYNGKWYDLAQPFTVKVLEVSSYPPSFYFYCPSEISATIQYRLNGGEWLSDYDWRQKLDTGILKAGDEIEVWNRSSKFRTDTEEDYYSGVRSFNISSYTVSGNISSLINYSSDLSSCSFHYLFMDQTNLTGAADLILPSGKADKYTYSAMFYNTRISRAPVIRCREYELGAGVFRAMFYNCPNLNRVEVDFTHWEPWGTQMEDDFEYFMTGCSSTGTFVKPAALPEYRGSNRIPEGWTVINK